MSSKSIEASLEPNIPELSKKYHVLQQIGSGTYGQVYRAKNIATGTVVALKVIEIESHEGIPPSAIREMSILKRMNHPNVIKLLDIEWESVNRIILVFEFMKCDMFTFRKMQPWNVQDVRYYLYQLLLGTEYCHVNRILHRDLKPQNLLINEEGHLKIADFGLARSYGIPIKTYTNHVVTLFYRSPDLLMGNCAYKTHVDMWSIGCILGEWLRGKPLFTGKNNAEMLQCIYNTLGMPTGVTFPSLPQLPRYAEFKEIKAPAIPSKPLSKKFAGVDPLLLDLLHLLLQYEPNRRISAKAALSHATFDSVREYFQVGIDCKSQAINTPSKQTVPTTRALNLWSDGEESKSLPPKTSRKTLPATIESTQSSSSVLSSSSSSSSSSVSSLLSSG